MGKPKAPKSTSTAVVDQKTTNTVTPYEPAKSVLDNMLKAAQTAYDNTPKTPAWEGPNQDQLAAVDAARGASGRDYYVDANNLRTNANSLAGPQATWNADINPYVQGMIKAAINPLRDQLDSNVLSIGDAAKLAGAYGGDRQELMKGTALSRFNRDAMDVGSQISYQATDAERQRAFQSQESEKQRMLQAAQLQSSLLQDAQGMGLEPARILSGIGDQQMSWDQAKKLAEIDAPWAGLDRLGTILGSVTPYASQSGTNTGTTTTTTTGTPGGGGLQGGISGALGGAAAGAQFGPWGAAIGGVAGGLGGLFG